MRINIPKEEYTYPESIGQQPKYWINSYGKNFLCKLATYKKQDGSPIYNDVSECIAEDIGLLIGLDMADYELCTLNGKNAVVTPDFLDNEPNKPKKEELISGVQLISLIDPGFKNTSLINPKTHQFYTVDLILQSIAEYGLEKDALNMLVFDALIANRDRNPSNYGVIINHENNTIRFSPLYDNAASLGISMVDHRLRDCIDSFGMVIDEKHLDIVIHSHIVGKVTLERFLQYKEKREWDKKELDRISRLIEDKRQELLPLVEEAKITRNYYHEQLYKVGKEYRKYDVSTLQYQQLISHLTLFYDKEIEDIMENIEANITEENIDRILSNYIDELPPDRIKMAREIVLKRKEWMVNYYNKHKLESRGKLL